MTDQCIKCSAHGDYAACMGLDCGKHEDWITRELLEQLTILRAGCQKWQEYLDAEYRERKKYRQDANHFAGEVERLTAEKQTLITFIMGIRDNYDCNADAHKYHDGCGCRCCEAAKILEGKS